MGRKIKELIMKFRYILSILLFSVIAFGVSNKVLEGDVIKSPDHTKVWTPPAATDTLVGRASTDTLTNKSISGATNTLTAIPLSTAVTGVLPVANGGTNSSTALTNGKVIVSLGGSVVESTVALTSNANLIFNAGGTATVGTKDQTTLGSDYLALVTGSTTGTNASGGLQISTGGTAGAASSGSYDLSTGDANGTQSGDVNIYSGTGAGATSSSGIISITSGTVSGSGTRGRIELGASRIDIIDNQAMRFYDADNSNYVSLISPAVVASNVALTLPSSACAANTVIRFGSTGVMSCAQVALSSDVTGSLPIANGGTGQTTANAAFNALSPMTTGGDLIYGGASGVGTRLANGTVGQVLTSGGTTVAPSWTSAGSGTVTSVAQTVPAFLSIAGSPITGSGTLAITLSGTALPIANGGTASTTAAAAFNALSPMTTGGDLIYGGASGVGTRLANGSAGQVLTSNGTTTAPTWNTVTGTGTVTSVAASVPSIFSIAGSPITTSGTLAMTYSGTALPVANGGTGLTAGTSGGVLAYTASGTLASSGALTASQLVIGGGAGVAPSTLAAGVAGQLLTASSAAIPAYEATWYVDATIDGANPSLGIAAVTSYTEIANSGLTLHPKSGSANVGVMCSSTNAATAPSSGDTTCAAGSESVGINFALPANHSASSGTYEVCFYGSWEMYVDQGEAIFGSTELIETPTNAQTLTLEGGTRQYATINALSIATGTAAGGGSAIANCSIFNWTAKSASAVVGVRLMYEQGISGTPNISRLVMDAAGGYGQPNGAFTVRRVR